MINLSKRIEEKCKKYDLPVFENPRDNMMILLEAAEPSNEDKLEVLDLYDEFLIEQYKAEVTT